MATHALNCAILSCFKVLEVTLRHMPTKGTKKPKITVFLPEKNQTNKKNKQQQKTKPTLKIIFNQDTFHLAMCKYHRNDIQTTIGSHTHQQLKNNHLTMQKCRCMKKDCIQTMQVLWRKKLLCPLKGNGILCSVQSLGILERYFIY